MKRINLLPKLKQRELGYEQTFYSVAVAVVIATTILLLGVVAQIGVWAYLDRTSKSIDANIEQLKRVANKSENAEVKTKIKLVNAQIGDFTNLSAQTPQWSKIIAEFVKHVPNDVKISQFDANTELGEVTVTGYSPTRDLVIDLYNNINADKAHFKNINYPLENVTQPTDVRFYFTFSIAEGVLTKENK